MHTYVHVCARVPPRASSSLVAPDPGSLSWLPSSSPLELLQLDQPARRHLRALVHNFRREQSWGGGAEDAHAVNGSLCHLERRDCNKGNGSKLRMVAGRIPPAAGRASRVSIPRPSTASESHKVPLQHGWTKAKKLRTS